jgi:N-acyl-D-amino-acid deacylase
MYDVVLRGGTIVNGTGAAPFTGDVAVSDGVIVQVGHVDGPSKRTVDADGALVTPGWIDAHTHYDGQVTWDDRMEGSAANGVTTVVMGNCGVGFAPVQAGSELDLIDLMEGVENIPGTALYEGMPWGKWESFPEYLDFLGTREWTVDVGAQIAHSALRFYVMGERALKGADATAEDVAIMAGLVEEAAWAGALGFSTSRIQYHRSLSGYAIPGTFAPEEELQALALALRAGGGATFQGIPSQGAGEMPALGPEQATISEDVEMFARISRESGLNVTFTTQQISTDPDAWREVLRISEEENVSGAHLYPMVCPRGTTVLTTLQGYHVFMRRPTYLSLAHLPLNERQPRCMPRNAVVPEQCGGPLRCRRSRHVHFRYVDPDVPAVALGSGPYPWCAFADGAVRSEDHLCSRDRVRTDRPRRSRTRQAGGHQRHRPRKPEE